MDLRSKISNRLLLTLVLCIAAGATCGALFYQQYMLKHIAQFKDSAGALNSLTDSAIITYAQTRLRSGADELPLPSTYFSHTSKHFNENYSGDAHYYVSMVGPPGRYIVTPPSDQELHAVFESMEDGKVESVYAATLDTPDDKIQRFFYPVTARNPACVDCHNKIQNLDRPWELGDVLGGLVIERSILDVARDAVALATLVGSLVSIMLFLGLQALQLHRDLQLRVLQLKKQADRDSLTGCLNRRALDAVIAKTSSAAHESAAVLFLDLDHFKRINDEHGHAVGDQVLVWFSATVRGMLRPNDSLVRSGGEEFTLYMPDVTEADAQRVAQRICDQVGASEQQFGQARLRVTVSIGGVHTSRSPGLAFKAYEKVADALLYTAKSNGRNQVAWSESS